MTSRGRLFASLLVLLATASPAHAKRQPVYFTLSLEQRHDDNVLQLTQNGFDRFASNSSAPRFLIESPDDNARIVRAGLRWQARPLPRRDTRIALSGEAARFANSDILNRENFGATLMQELTASRRFMVRLALYRNVTPRYYLGQITDTDASLAAGTRIRRALEYRQRVTGLRVEEDWRSGRVQASLARERVKRDYGSFFNERDNDNDQWHVEAATRPLTGHGLLVRVEWLSGTLDARGDLAATEVVDTDISYQHRGLGVGIEVPWGKGTRRGRASVSFMPEHREYTTPDIYDLNRYGRVNDRRELTMAVTQRLWGPFETTLTWNRLTSDASFPTGTDQPEEATDFRQSQTGLLLRGRWDLFAR